MVNIKTPITNFLQSASHIDKLQYAVDMFHSVLIEAGLTFCWLVVTDLCCNILVLHDQAIEKRISVYSQVPIENGELIQVLRYGSNLHTDEVFFLNRKADMCQYQG